MTNEELIMKLSMLQEEGKKLEEEINLINNKISEFVIMKNALDKIKNNEEILAPIGQGVFVKSLIKEEKLFMNIGNNIVVRKSPKQAGEIIEKQIVKLEAMRKQLFHEIEHLNHEMIQLIEKAQSIGVESES